MISMNDFPLNPCCAWGSARSRSKLILNLDPDLNLQLEPDLNPDPELADHSGNQYASMEGLPLYY